MKTMNLLNYALDGWYQASGGLAEVESAVTGETIATTGSQGLDFKAMLQHARNVGGPALRRLTFHERAHMLKALGLAIMAVPRVCTASNCGPLCRLRPHLVGEGQDLIDTGGLNLDDLHEPGHVFLRSGCADEAPTLLWCAAEHKASAPC